MAEVQNFIKWHSVHLFRHYVRLQEASCNCFSFMTGGYIVGAPVIIH